MHYITQHAQLVPRVNQRIKNRIVHVLYLLMSWAQNHGPDKWIRWVKLVPRAIRQIKKKGVEVLYLLLSSAQNHPADKCITWLNMSGFCPGPFNELKIKLLMFFISC